jgi:RNA polymerase sigma factor (sigma-70 family)
MDATSLLEHRDFVLCIARALLRDESDAEDAVQDTYLAAMESAPPKTGRTRAWLGGITRNIARNRQRADARRQAREKRVARPERTAAESSEKLRWQQRVVEAVLELDPKYRDPLVLRFYEDMPPREVAERLDIPVNTVRTRNRRAIEQLRAVFDSRHGGRAAWSAGIALLLVGSATAGISKALVVGVLIAVGVGTSGLVVWSQQNPVTSERRESSAAAHNRVERAGTTAKATAASESPEDAEVPRVFHGRLWEVRGHPPATLSGATVHLVRRGTPWSTSRSTTTDGNGRFSFELEPAWKSFRSKGSTNLLLYASRDGLWSDSINPTAEGFKEGDGFRARVELLESPKLQLVSGRAKTPIVGATVSLHVIGPIALQLGTMLSSSVTDAEGLVQSEWPTWCAGAIVRVARLNGDVVQWPLDRLDASMYDPYDFRLDDQSIATVRVPVLDKEGAPVGAGIRVICEGDWAPDGIPEGPYPTTPGALYVPLIGSTDKDGVATFRFVADRASHGAYLATRLVAVDDRVDPPRWVMWGRAPERTVEEESAQSGRALPILRFGVTKPSWSAFAARDVFEIYKFDSDGILVQLIPRFRLRMGRTTLYGFPGYPKDDFTKSIHVVSHTDKGIGAATISIDDAFRGDRTVLASEFHKACDIQFRAPNKDKLTRVRLRAGKFIRRFFFYRDGPAVISVPATPGPWEVYVNGERRHDIKLDPTKQTDYDVGSR